MQPLLTAASPLLAHGLAVEAGDLPLPLRAFYLGAAAALVLSFALLALGARVTARTEADGAAASDADRPLPTKDSLAGARALRVLASVLAIAWLVAVAVTGLWGSTEASENPAPNLVFVLGWLGLPVAAVLLGRAALALHPLAALARTGQLREHTGATTARVGLWPAWAGLLLFVWLELVYPTSTRPQLVAALVLAWAVSGVALASRVGVRPWLEHLDPVGAYVRLLASLAPWGRRADGRTHARLPLIGSNRDVPGERGLVAVVTLLIASVSYDGLTRTGWWQDRVALATADLAAQGVAASTARMLFGSFALACMLLIAWLAFEAASWSAAKVGHLRSGRGAARAAQQFAPSLIPIALAYVVAHYFSFFVVQVQDLVRLASDPLGTGADLFGTAGRTVRDLRRPDGTTVWIVQVGAIVVGHVAGLLLAHERALALAPRRADGRPDRFRATCSQLPMLALMLLYTVGGLYFLSEGLS